MSQSILVAPPAPASRLNRAIPRHVLTGIMANEWVVLCALLLVIGCGFLVRLESVVVSDMDEGTYVYAGKLVAEGQMPYRDFMLSHPPMIALLTGGWQALFGTNLMAIRIAYLVVILAAAAPLYAITRACSRSRLAGLVSMAAYLTGMLLLANMGRTVRLEPVMNAFLIGALAGYVARPNSLRVRVLVGVLLACAILVKLVAAVPAVLLLVGDLIWSRPDRRFVASWAATAAGAALILVPASAFLLSQPHFLDDVILAQFDRPGLPLQLRLYFLTQNFTRYPVIPVGLLAAVWLLVRAADVRLRTVSLVALGSTAALVLAFKTFYGYYIVQALPWIAVAFAVTLCPIVERIAGRWARPLILAGTLVLAGVVPAAYGEVYHRTAHEHVSSPTRIVALLREGDGYLYSMYPSFSLASGRELYPWYGIVDSLVPRITKQIGDDDFLRVFSECTALVLWPDELAEYPRTRTYVEEHFAIAYEDAYYTLWIRPTQQSPGSTSATLTPGDEPTPSTQEAQ